MECPFCADDNTRVLESRSAEDSRSIRRRRECAACSERFTTYERIESTPLIIIKSNGNKEVYSRDKLLSSIVRSCSKSQISTLTVDHIIEQSELAMQKQGRDIQSAKVGEIVMQFLKEADVVAYLRYASIFKKFSSISEFLDELRGLEDQELGIEFQAAEKSILSEIKTS